MAEEEEETKHTLYLLILQATYDSREDIRSQASENLLKLCTRNGGVVSLVRIFTNLNRIEVIQMLEFWTKTELQKIQRKRSTESEYPQSNGEQDQKEGRVLERTTHEKRFVKKETTAKACQEGDHRGGEIEAVEDGVRKIAAIDNLAGIARALGKLKKQIRNSERVSENLDTRSQTVQTEERVNVSKVRDVDGVVSQRPFGLRVVDARNVRDQGGHRDNTTLTGGKDNKTSITHSQTSVIPTTSSSLSSSSSLSPSSSSSSASSLPFLINTTLTFTLILVILHSDGPSIDGAARSAPTPKWVLVGLSGTRVAFRFKLQPQPFPASTTSSYGRTTARGQWWFTSHSSDPPDEYSSKNLMDLQRSSKFWKNKEKKCSTIQVEVKKLQHRDVIGPRGNAINKILAETGVIVKMLSNADESETITLRGTQEKLGLALTKVYEKANSVVNLVLPCSSWLHKYIIGKKGAGIQRISQDLPKVHFRDVDTIKVDGPPDEVEKARLDLEDQVAKLVKDTAFADVEVDAKYHKHIIGKGGSTVNKIKSEADVTVNIPDTDSGATVIRIKDNEDGVETKVEKLQATTSYDQLQATTSYDQQFLAKIEEEETWISEKQQLLTVPDHGDNMAAVQGLLRKHDAFETDISGHDDRCTDICEHGQQLIEECNHHADSIAQRCEKRGTRSPMSEKSFLKKARPATLPSLRLAHDCERGMEIIKDYEWQSRTYLKVKAKVKHTALTLLGKTCNIWNSGERCKNELIHNFSDIFGIAINLYKRFQIYNFGGTEAAHQGQTENTKKDNPNRIIYNDFRTRYVILASKDAVATMKKVKRPVTEEKKNIAATHAVMDKINLVGDKFQYGHTKIFFRAGILNLMEKIRDNCINNLVAMMQGSVRAYYAHRIYNRLWKHKMGLLVAQRAIRGYMIGKTWLWWSLWLALKPGLKSGQFEEFKQQLAEKTQFAQDHLDEVIDQRDMSQEKHAQLTSEVNEIKVSLAGGTNAKEDLLSKITKLEDIKGGLQKEINALNTKINQENEQIEGLQKALKKTEASQRSLGRGMRECVSRWAQVQDEKADKDAQIKHMKEECLHQDEVEDSWDREKKQKGDIEKLKRQMEGNLKLTQEILTDLKRNKIEMGQVLQRKEKENRSLNGRVEDEQTLGGKLNTQIKELQAWLEELDEKLEAERQSRARADQGRGTLRRELDELNGKLAKTGSNTTAQIAPNTRREEKLAKLKMELVESNFTHESTLAMLKQKHNGSIAEMGEQIDSLHKAKAKTEKERNDVALELKEIQQQLDNDQNEKMALEKQGKMIQQQIYDAQGRLEELQRALHEANGSKREITVESCDLVHQFEEAERTAATLSKDRSSLTTQLEEAKRLADAKTREGINLLGKMRNLQHELEVMQEPLGEEADAKMEVEKQLSKAFADIQLWKTRYETEGVARCEKIASLEKAKACAKGGRSMHELDNSRRKLEVEKEELQNGVEEAETALEQEENKVLRAQLAMSQVRQDIDRRIQEKEEEFEHSRKNHQRALESIQASLEAEARAKEEALRIKKKNEADIKEMEIALDHANKAHSEGKKAMKRTHMQLGDVNAAIEEERKFKNKALQAYGLTERKVNAMSGELEESKALLEATVRGQKQVEQELIDPREQVTDVSASNKSLDTPRGSWRTTFTRCRLTWTTCLPPTRTARRRPRRQWWTLDVLPRDV